MGQWQGMREAAKLGWCLSAGRAGEAGLISSLQIEAPVGLSLLVPPKLFRAIGSRPPQQRHHEEIVRAANLRAFLSLFARKLFLLVIETGLGWVERKFLAFFKFTSSSQTLLRHSPPGNEVEKQRTCLLRLTPHPILRRSTVSQCC